MRINIQNSESWEGVTGAVRETFGSCKAPSEPSQNIVFPPLNSAPRVRLSACDPEADPRAELKERIEWVRGPEQPSQDQSDKVRSKTAPSPRHARRSAKQVTQKLGQTIQNHSYGLPKLRLGCV